MSDTNGEGCGIWPIILRKTKAVHACDWHDLAYLENSWHQKNMSRKEVDQWFRDQMLRVADSRLGRAQAHIFYRIARLLGGFWWEGRK